MDLAKSIFCLLLTKWLKSPPWLNACIYSVTTQPKLIYLAIDGMKKTATIALSN